MPLLPTWCATFEPRLSGGTSNDESPQASDRSRFAHRSHLGACSARKVDSAWAYLDTAHLVGAAAVGGVPGGYLRRPLARSGRSALSAGVSRGRGAATDRVCEEGL